MRRIVVWITAGVVAMSPVGTVGAEPYAGAGGGQLAMAEWFSFGGLGFRDVFVGAFRGLDGAAEVYVWVDECTPKKRKKGKAKRKRIRMTCTTEEYLVDVPADALQVDPLLDSATLRASLGGGTVEVDWAGEGDSPIVEEYAVVAPDEGAGGGVSAYRWASAGGSVLGRTVEPARDGMSTEDGLGLAVLYEGAGAIALFEEYEDDPAGLRRELRERASA